MQITQETINPTKIKLTIVAEADELEPIKQVVVKQLAGNLKLPGFREGKAPANLVEKNIDPATLQNDFLNEALNRLYDQAITEKKVRIASQPEVSITKFVPFTTLEFTAEVEAVGEIKLADYKKIKVVRNKPIVASTDVDEVVENLRSRSAEKVSVKRAAKNEDEVTIDFFGSDAKTNEPIDGADGKDYPLALGSKSFIPGFEEQVIGLKPGNEKEFEITFPKDYGSASLQNKLVKFKIIVKDVKELNKPKLDDAFAKTVGPFTTVDEFKKDIRAQLVAEKTREADQTFDNEYLQKIVDVSTIPVPAALIEEELNRLEDEEKRNLVYRGQTWQEHLDSEGVTEEEHRERNRPQAETRVKAGLVLGEIADKEGITVSKDELETRLNLMRSQYQDPQMLAELDKPENRRDIVSRVMIEKTLDKLRSLADSPAKN